MPHLHPGLEVIAPHGQFRRRADSVLATKRGECLVGESGALSKELFVHPHEVSRHSWSRARECVPGSSGLSRCESDEVRHWCRAEGPRALCFARYRAASRCDESRDRERGGRECFYECSDPAWVSSESMRAKRSWVLCRARWATRSTCSRSGARAKRSGQSARRRRVRRQMAARVSRSPMSCSIGDGASLLGRAACRSARR